MKNTLKIKRKNFKLTTLGFTLIELLAVIVILAIISVIAVPIVLNIIDETKDNATLRSADFYLDAVETSIATSTLKNKNISDGTYNILESGNICLSYDADNKCIEELIVEVKGEVPSVGSTIIITSGKISAIELKYGEKTIVKNEKGELIYQTIPTPKSFAEDDWETIAKNVKAGNLSKYNVGDKKKIKLTSEDDNSGNADGITTGEYTIRIANTSNEGDVCTKEYLEKADGSKEKYSKTACGFVIEFEDIITTHVMNPKGEYKGTQYDYGWNVDGWPASSMRTYVNNEVYNALPEGLRNVIIPTTVVSGHGSTSGETNFVTTDKVYLLSTGEVWEQGTSNTINNDTARYNTRQLDYYKDEAKVTTSSYGGAIKKINGSAYSWWLRSACSHNTHHFYGVCTDGDWYYSNAINANGVAVAFRLG